MRRERRALALLVASGALRTFRRARRAGLAEGVAFFLVALAGVALPFVLAILGGVR